MDKKNQKSTKTEFHVRYAETDAMGIVHHANYPVYFEEGRSQLMRDLGSNYAEIEAAGYRMPVTELGVRYVGSFRYGEKAEIHTHIDANHSRRVTFTYDVFNSETGKKVASGFTKHIWTDKNGKVTRIPNRWAMFFSSQAIS